MTCRLRPISYQKVDGSSRNAQPPANFDEKTIVVDSIGSNAYGMCGFDEYVIAAILQPSVPLTKTQVSLPRFSSFPSARNTKSKYTDAIVPSLFCCRCVCVGLKLAFEVETNFAKSA